MRHGVFGIALALATSAVLSACGRAEPTTTPEATATPCPVNADACAFAALLNGWLVGGEFDSILATWRPTEYECPGPVAQGLGGPYPLCDDAYPSEVREGYAIGTDTHGFVVSAQQLRNDELRRWRDSALANVTDRVGGGAFAVYSIGCWVSDNEGPDACDQKFSAVLSAIVDGGSSGQFRTYVVFLVVTDPASGGHSITGLVTVGPTPDLPNTLVNGGRSKALPAELGKYAYHPWQ